MHFAALNLPDESVDKPIEYYDDNSLGTAKLLEAMRLHGVKHMIYSSTSSVYGEVEKSPVKEDHPLNPISPYGHSKVLGEEIINYYSRVHGMNSVIFRYFNVCGADDDGAIGDSKKPSQLLVQNCVRGALGLEPFQYTCSQVNTPDGTPIRDFIDVRDLADAHLAAMEYLLKGGATETMNLGTGSGYSVKEIVTKVEQILNVKIERGQGKARAGEYSASFADASKAKAVLGWTAKRSLADSVTALVNWYQKHPKGYIR
jgi:UDP-glucose 4-epimerase